MHMAWKQCSCENTFQNISVPNNRCSKNVSYIHIELLLAILKSDEQKEKKKQIGINQTDIEFARISVGKKCVKAYM
jgi:hypothetical protein